jgi:hypothetical protein
MKYKNNIISISLLLAFVIVSLACQQQANTNSSGNTNSAQAPVQTVKAGSPTESYKMLFAACKAKDTATIKQLMSKGSLGLAEFSASQQKKPVEKILENGLVAPTLSETITEIRDERIKDNFARIEVYNAQDKRWEDLPFVFEDGSWKLAVGDLFQNTFDPNQTLPKSKGQTELDASNKGMPVPSNVTNFPDMNSNGKGAKNPTTDGTKSVEVPKEKKP